MIPLDVLAAMIQRRIAANQSTAAYAAAREMITAGWVRLDRASGSVPECGKG